MEFICSHCHAVIQIADERVPQNSTFRLPCPRCKGKIVASTKVSECQESARSNIGIPRIASEAPCTTTINLDEGLPQGIDFLQPGQSAALLCINRKGSCDQLKATLEGLGYVVNIPASAEQALQRLRFNQYHVILLDDDFEGTSSHSVADYLAGLNMNIRRDMFVVIIGHRFKTGDHLQAFIENANLLLHPDDLQQLATLMTRGMRNHERFYKVFTECLIEAGKKI